MEKWRNNKTPILQMASEENYFKAMHQSGWSSFWKFHWSEIPLTFCLPGRIFTKCNLIRWLRGFQPITVRMTFQIIDEACLATPTSNELLVWSSSGHFTRAFTMRVTCMKLDWCIIPCTTEFYRDRRLNRDSPGQTGTYGVGLVLKSQVQNAKFEYCTSNYSVPSP